MSEPKKTRKAKSAPRPAAKSTGHLPPDFVQLVKFIHGCATHPGSCAQLVLGLLVALWQTAGPALGHRVPWLLTVSGDENRDPLQDFLRLISLGVSSGTGPCGPFGNFKFARPRDIEVALEQMIREHGRLHEQHPELARDYARRNRSKFQEGIHSIHIGGLNARYGLAWQPGLGLVTDQDNHVILHLEEDDDWKLFLEHLTNDREMIAESLGINYELMVQSKSYTVAGHVPVSRWDPQLCDLLLETQPVICMPHAAALQSEWDKLDLLLFATRFRDLCMSRAFRPLNVRIESFQAGFGRSIERQLRQRLLDCPSGHGHVIGIIIRQLRGLCQLTAAVASAKRGGFRAAEGEDNIDLARDLLGLALAGLLISVRALGYHLHGIPLPVPQAQARKILNHIRGRQSLRRRELQRDLHLNKQALDPVLEVLAAEGLVRPEGNQVLAVELADYLKETTRSWDGLPPLNLRTEALYRRIREEERHAPPAVPSFISNHPNK